MRRDDLPEEKPQKEVRTDPQLAYDQTWICIARMGNRYEIKEIGDCSPQLFQQWLKQVLPNYESRGISFDMIRTREQKEKILLSIAYGAPYPQLLQYQGLRFSGKFR